MKITRIKWLMAGCLAGSLVLLASWGNQPGQVQRLNIRNVDTVPERRDLDKELQQLSIARKQLENLNKQDFSAMQQQLQESLAQLDQNKIQLQVENAMKEVNLQQSLRAAEDAMKSIDLDKIMAEVDAESRLTAKEREKIRQEISKAKIEVEKELKNKDWRELKEVDLKEIEKEMQQARVELEEARKEMGENGSNIRKELADASKDVDEAEAELKGYQQLIYKLESAKLLDTKKDYRIEWNAPELTINGKVQPKAVSDSYKKYFKDDKTLIRKENGKMNIRKGNDDTDD
jgi:chromosome segregation ATPase